MEEIINRLGCLRHLILSGYQKQTLEIAADKIEQLQAELEVAKEDLARMTGNYQTHAQINSDLQAENTTLREITRIKDPEQHFEQIIEANKYIRAELAALNVLFETRSLPANTPPVVCLCGSTRFMDAFFEAGWKFTLEGRIVLSIGVCKHAEHHGGEALGREVADKLDELHLRKIDLADSVYVLNVGGYIGESTSKEIEYAKSRNKPIEYLERALKGVEKDENRN